MNQKLLVTGARGLVGSTIECDFPIAREYDLKNSYECDKMFAEKTPTHVIHCAAKVGGLGANMNFKGEFFYDNIMINTNVVESARKHNVKNFLGFLSTCIFPDKVDYPLDESKIHLGPPHDSNYPYAYAKRMLDVQINAYREQFGLNYTTIIPTNVYGPNDNFSLTHGHVIPMLINKMYLAKKNNTFFEVWGSGEAKREFIYSEDLGKIAKFLVGNEVKYTTIIASDSQEIKIKDLVDLIIQEFNFKGKVVFDTSKPDGQLRKPTNSGLLKELMPDFTFTPIESGMRQTINWFIENYDNARK